MPDIKKMLQGHKFSKAGTYKEKTKVKGSTMTQVNKDLPTDDVSGSKSTIDRRLDKLGSDLEKKARSMYSSLKTLKRALNRHLRSGDLIKDAKTIFKEYYEDYKDLTLDSLEEFLKICEKYGAVPADKLDYEIYRRMFETMRISAKEKRLTPERLKMFSRKIFDDLKQTGEAGDGTINNVMHPFMAFMQSFLKMTLFLPQLIERLSSDNYSLFQVRKIKNEMESTVLKKLGIVDLTKLKSEEYRNECKEKLAQFSEEIASFATELNERQRKLGNSDSDYRLGALMKQFVN